MISAFFLANLCRIESPTDTQVLQFLSAIDTNKKKNKGQYFYEGNVNYFACIGLYIHAEVSPIFL